MHGTSSCERCHSQKKGGCVICLKCPQDTRDVHCGNCHSQVKKGFACLFEDKIPEWVADRRAIPPPSAFSEEEVVVMGTVAPSINYPALLEERDLQIVGLEGDLEDATAEKDIALAKIDLLEAQFARAEEELLSLRNPESPTLNSVMDSIQDMDMDTLTQQMDPLRPLLSVPNASLPVTRAQELEQERIVTLVGMKTGKVDVVDAEGNLRFGKNLCD